ncbi:MAG: hypothetical protein KDD22_05395 [Bdellovibrionales bacterium]|nr:hypothetical protein [Bdellovibrionales bacterium]
MESAGQQIQIHGGNMVEVAVPLGLFLCIVLVVLSFLYFRTLQLKEVQKSIQAMVEKGMNVPVELIVKPERRSKRSDLKRGLVLLASGVSISLAMWISEPQSRDWAWGFVPLACKALPITSKILSSADDCWRFGNSR